jgi:cation transport regulator
VVDQGSALAVAFDVRVCASSLAAEYALSRVDIRRLMQSCPRVPMPYRSNDDLPPPVRSHLPPHAQDIYREAFNHAFATHAGDPRQEEAAHRIAWGAVKRRYAKAGDRWVAREAGG